MEWHVTHVTILVMVKFRDSEGIYHISTPQLISRSHGKAKLGELITRSGK